MSNYQQEMYALQDRDGNLIGIDYQSGGYPLVPTTLYGVWLEENPERMQQYDTSGKYTLVKVKVTVEKI